MQKPRLPRYILCQYIATSKDKSDKIPLNPHTLHAHNPLDPSIHMTLDAAIALASALGGSYGVGYVFMPGDGYFFIDLDNCLMADNTWSISAVNTMSQLHGAYVEISHSMRGLHIIGRYEGDPPFKGKRLKDIEIYTEGRFCALTGTNAIGDAQSTHTEAFHRLIEFFGLSEDINTQQLSEWTTEAPEDANVPEDNKKLLDYILNRAPSAQEIFGSVISFRDLWENNKKVLAKHFPSSIVGKRYDYSAADAALAYRLHYFTGRNCERVLELMNLSKLKRDKWENSANYLPRTIINARGRQLKYFTYARSPQTYEDDSKNKTQTQQYTGTILTVEQQISYFQKCTYVAESHQILTPEGVLYKPETFNSMYGGVTFQLDLRNEKMTRKAFEAFTLSQGYAFPKVHRTNFKPLLEFSTITEEEGLRYVNTYRPIETPRIKAPVDLFLQHIKKLVPDENDRLILLSYMAALIQYKGVKFTWCVIIQGTPGNGKTLLNDILSFCIGRQYVHTPKSSELTGKFNGWMANNLLITIDDIYQSSWDMIETLKPMITNQYLEIERKGIDKVTQEIFCNFFLCTNNRDGVPKTRDDRRFAPFFTAQQEYVDIQKDGMDGEYFPILRRWLYKEDGLAAINEYLSTFEIPDKYNPTTTCIRAPITTSTEDAIKCGLTTTATIIQEWIEESCIGFRKGWLSSILINRKLLENNIKINPKQIPLILMSIGYKPHPGLNKGRATRIIKTDNGQSRLYTAANHYSFKLKEASQIIDAYELDQK